jgi:hypothetical protein
MSPMMLVGSLVRTNPDTDFSVLGIVTKIRSPLEHQLWYNQHIVTVLYTDTGESVNWAGDSLELIS